MLPVAIALSAQLKATAVTTFQSPLTEVQFMICWEMKGRMCSYDLLILNGLHLRPFNTKKLWQICNYDLGVPLLFSQKMGLQLR